jgi:hypothetical protein
MGNGMTGGNKASGRQHGMQSLAQAEAARTPRRPRCTKLHSSSDRLVSSHAASEASS